MTERGKVGETYNLGTDFELSINQLAKAIHNEVTKQHKGKSTPFST